MKRRYLLLLPLISVLAAGAAVSPAGQRWWNYVAELAGDKYEGRETGSPGYRKAGEFVAGEFKRLGLKPAGNDYFQPVPLAVRRIREEASSLILAQGSIQEVVQLGRDAYFNLAADFPATLQAQAVFAGYGLTVPESNYDDLAGLDLKGKIVVYLRGGPTSIPGPLRAHYQSLQERWAFLRRAGAIGMAGILDPQTMEIPWDRYAQARLLPFMSIADPRLDEAPGLRLALTINPARADTFFTGTGHTIAEILELAHAGKPLPKFPMPYSIRAALSVNRTDVASDNVAAILPGRDPRLRNEYVVVSAHLDHLGTGAPVQGDAVYHGAMDDASGVASLFEIARTLKAAPPRRSVLFVAVTGEEKGLLGSRYFAAYPPVKPESLVADLNLDMFLPLFPLRVLTVYGLDESSLGRDVLAVARAYAVRVQPDPQPERNVFIRSDQYNFIRAGVPSLLFGFGYGKGSPQERIEKDWLASRYHAPADNASQPVNLAAAVRFNRLIAALAARVANQPQRPQWNSTSFFSRFAR